MTFEKTNNNPSLPGVTYATEPQFSEQNIDNNQAINPYEYKGKPAFERFTLEKEPQDTFTVVKKPGRISVLTTSAAPNDLSRPYYKPKENK